MCELERVGGGEVGEYSMCLVGTGEGVMGRKVVFDLYFDILLSTYVVVMVSCDIIE